MIRLEMIVKVISNVYFYMEIVINAGRVFPESVIDRLLPGGAAGVLIWEVFAICRRRRSCVTVIMGRR